LAAIKEFGAKKLRVGFTAQIDLQLTSMDTGPCGRVVNALGRHVFFVQ